MDYSMIITLGGMAVSIIVWLVRLEGKVKTLEKVFNLYRETGLKTEETIDKAIQQLFDLVREVKSIVDEIKGELKNRNDERD